MAKNVAWAMTRHRNLMQVTKILDQEAEELRKVNLVSAADELMDCSGAVHALMIRELESLELAWKTVVSK